VALLAVTVTDGHADLNLDKLDCVAPVASLLEERADLTEAQLQLALAAALRARLPGLKLEPNCSDSLYFRVVVVPAVSVDKRMIGYFGAARVELLRSAILLGGLTRTELTVWEQAWTLSGPPGDEVRAIFSALTGLLDGFAAAYHKVPRR
jgi:hypothetical protein